MVYNWCNRSILLVILAFSLSLKIELKLSLPQYDEFWSMKQCTFYKSGTGLPSPGVLRLEHAFQKSRKVWWHHNFRKITLHSGCQTVVVNKANEYKCEINQCSKMHTKWSLWVVFTKWRLVTVTLNHHLPQVDPRELRPNVIKGQLLFVQFPFSQLFMFIVCLLEYLELPHLSGGNEVISLHDLQHILWHSIMLNLSICIFFFVLFHKMIEITKEGLSIELLIFLIYFKTMWSSDIQ